MGEAHWLRGAPDGAIEVDGCVVRRWARDDLDALVAAVTASLTHLRPWMPWASGFDRESARGFLARGERSWRERSEFVYGIFAEDGRSVLGGCGLHARIGPGGLEMGYWVDASHHRRGIATRAGAVLTAQGASLPGVTHLEIHHDRANVPSAGIPRKLGYTFVGERPDTVDAPGESGVERVWRMRAEEFSSSPAAHLLREDRGAR